MLMADTSVSLLERLSLEPDEHSWKQFVDLYAPLIGLSIAIGRRARSDRLL